MFGLKMTNNQTHDYWLLAASPEWGISSHFMSVLVDGMAGSYTPVEDAHGYVQISRLSVVPLLQLNWHRFRISSGYGFCFMYRRTEIHDIHGALSITPGQIQHGEFRANLGYRFPLRPGMDWEIKTGYAYVDKNFRCFSAGMGMVLTLGRTLNPIVSTYPPQSDVQRKPLSLTRKPVRLIQSGVLMDSRSNPLNPIRISRISIVHQTDPIVEELNDAIEVALIQAGLHVVNWEKICETVRSQSQNAPAESETASSPSAGLQAVMKSRSALDISTAVETSLRYTFKAYGGDVLVQAAYVKIIDLDSGNVIWASDFNMPDASFNRCKKKLSEWTTDAFNRFSNGK